MTFHEKKTGLLKEKIEIKKVAYKLIPLGILILCLGIIGYSYDIIPWPILFIFIFVSKILIMFPLKRLKNINHSLKILSDDN